MEEQLRSYNAPGTSVVSTAKALESAFRETEITLLTDEGHFFAGGRAPSGNPGIFIVIVPCSDSVLEPGVMDIFSLGILRSNIQRMLADLSQGNTYKTRDDLSHVWIQNGRLNFAFRYKHLPENWFRCSISTTLSESILTWFSYHSGTRRNTLCPCNSGKKFKTCCARQVPHILGKNEIIRNLRTIPRMNEVVRNLSGVPPEIEWLATIDNDDVREFVDGAVMNPSVLQDSEYWVHLGACVGTLEYRQRAIDCFKRALELDPKNNHAKLNLAVELSSTLKQHDEALRIMDEIPVGTPRRSVILANVLSEKNDSQGAIPLYEQAILEEPDFALPYQKLLQLLEGHSLYEYWLEKAVRMLPSSPWIADCYARNLFKAQKYEDLAHADWIDEVKIEVDYSVIGHPDYAFEATRAQIVRQTAIAFMNPNQELIERLANKVSSIDPEWHLCDEGKTLALLCTNQGLPEFIPKFYDLVCQQCIDERIGGMPRAVDSLLASAHLVGGDYEGAISYSEKVLSQDPKSDEVLGTYYWALDEVGRTDEAIDVAKRLYDIGPEWNMEHLAHNLGLMSQHIGRLGEAQFYYERQLANGPHIHAQAALTFLQLLQSQFDEAEQSIQLCFNMMRNPTIAKDFLQPTIEFEGPWTEEDYQVVEVKEAIVRAKALQFDGWESLIEPEIEQQQLIFEELLAFAKSNAGSFTFARDLIEKNESFGESKIGPDSTIKPETYTIDQILALTGHGEDPAAYQAKFLLQLEQRGDFSVAHASVIESVPVFDQLPWEARASILEGERRFISDNPMLDYSTVAVAFAKAVEICLLQLVFVPYKSICNSTVTIFKEISIAQQNNNSQAVSLFKFLERGQHLELGSMSHLLRLCNGRTAEKEFLIGQLRDFIKFSLNGMTLLDNENVESIGSIARDFRNPGAHSEILTKAEAQECRQLCIGVLQRLEPCVAEERLATT